MPGHDPPVWRAHCGTFNLRLGPDATSMCLKRALPSMCVLAVSCCYACVVQVCLDLYLMRQVAASISAVPDVTTDWPALIDTWAVRFLHEMDYTREAANAQLFR